MVEEKAFTKQEDEILVMETNLDDCSPEILSYAMEQLFLAGAVDVFYTTIGMKKCRAGIKLTILCKKEYKEEIEKILFTETTTIGIRYRIEQRVILKREIKEVQTKYGRVKVKEVTGEYLPEGRNYTEYESAKELALKHQVPLHYIYEEVIKNQ